MTFSFYLPEAISTRFLIYMQRIFLDQLDGLLLEGSYFPGGGGGYLG